MIMVMLVMMVMVMVMVMKLTMVIAINLEYYLRRRELLLTHDDHVSVRKTNTLLLVMA